MRRIPAPVPPLSPSPAIGEILAAVLPCLSLFLFPWLSLSHTHIHTHTYIPSSLPSSHLSLSLSLSFLSPAPFPSDCQTRCQRSIAGCLRRNLRVLSFSLSLSLPTRTHTLTVSFSLLHKHTCMHPTTRHMNS